MYAPVYMTVMHTYITCKGHIWDSYAYRTPLHELSLTCMQSDCGYTVERNFLAVEIFDELVFS